MYSLLYRSQILPSTFESYVVEHGEWKAWTASHPWKNSEKTSHRKVENSRTYEPGKIYQAVGGPTTRHCSGSSVRDPKKNVGAKGVGGCENAWTFGGWYMDENSQFETWPFNGKWLFFWHFFNSRFDQHAFAPQDCRASAWCKALRFLWREMLDLFFSLAKLIVFNESVSPPMYTKWV